MRRTLISIVAVISFLLLLAAVPAVVRAGGGCHQPGLDGSTYTEGPATVVRMDVCSFAPTIARVPVGTAVRFLNTSNGPHAVLGRSGTWASETLQPGDEYSATFTSEGTYPFECPLHPGMVGAIVVGDGALDGAPGAAAPAAAVTSPPPRSATTDEGAASITSANAAGNGSLDWPLVVVVALAGLAAGAIGTTVLKAARYSPRES
jgi:plastocyanin